MLLTYFTCFKNNIYMLCSNFNHSLYLYNYFLKQISKNNLKQLENILNKHHIFLFLII